MNKKTIKDKVFNECLSNYLSWYFRDHINSHSYEFRLIYCIRGFNSLYKGLIES